ncbi:hypothetical protein GCM10009557_17900 [Virgisporangium ochraceum]|uniref:Beta-lactamase-related domain-containing protein n=1 Tax=Virgisporangium ochraceum TaxID=65505 RepID=A0A8J4EHZ0_9ACTN|nr:serine hydrolase domain-containing protein [Virgisporangium ochraceum]GIJ72687.1 hypothetical protein Voc01_076040 [Virgisporangium ochraceum]
MTNGGVALLVQGPAGDVAEYSEGMAVVEHAVPFTSHTVVKAASVAKQFTARLALLAADDGRLDLDDELATWVPDVPSAAHVRLIELMHHTSGIRDAETMLALMGLREYDYLTRTDVVALLSRQETCMFAPGTRFSYSNSNYILLGMVVERAFDETLAEVADRLLFSPAGLSDTGVLSRPDQVVARLAHSYAEVDGMPMRADRPTTIPGGSALFTSVSDLASWHRGETRREPANPALRRLLHEPGRLADGSSTGYGAGLFVERDGGGTGWFNHAGHEQGYSAQAVWSDAGHLIVCTTNRSDTDAAHVAGAAELALRSGGTPHEALARGLRAVGSADDDVDPVDAAPKTVTEASGWLGEYRCRHLPLPLRLDLDDGALALRRGSATDLLTVDGNDFAGPGYRLTLGTGRSFTISLPRAGDLEFVRVGAEV